MSESLARHGLVAFLLALAGCAAGGGGPSVTACGGPPPAPGAGGCQLICRAEIPLRYVDDTPRVSAWIDGTPADLVLDTGAGISAITEGARHGQADAAGRAGHHGGLARKRH